MFDIKSELKNVPLKPGVYLMKDKHDNVIYVGKAIALRNRLRQYFVASPNHSPKTQKLVSNITSFEFVVTDTEQEALIFECNLIKKYKPKFNILLKDDKNYPYIKITLFEEYPRVLITRKILKDGSKYFGPYTNSWAVKNLLKLIKDIFPIKTCNLRLNEFNRNKRPCLNFQIGKCLAPCSGNIDKSDYNKIIQDILNTLGGKYEYIVEKLTANMLKSSEKMDFENAALFRDKLKSIEFITEKQKVLSTEMKNQDIISYAKIDNDYCIEIFYVRSGKLIGRNHFIFENQQIDTTKDLLSSFIKQYYNTALEIPTTIIVKEEVHELDLLVDWLSDRRKSKVLLKVPQKGESFKLVNMVSQNAKASLNQFLERKRSTTYIQSNILTKISDLLQLNKSPKRIEAYDISNTGNLDIVASMVVYKNGKPSKKDYRKYKMKSIKQADDYGCMEEVLSRRFKPSTLKKDDVPNHIENYPDLILIDGGTGHVNVASNILNSLNLDIPCVGMVKNEKHATRGLIIHNNEVSLSSTPDLYRFITEIQNEAHRFAITYNKVLRKKRYQTSSLDNIKNVGPKRKKALIKYFSSVVKIKTATIDELLLVPGINKEVAQDIFNYYRK